MSSRIRWKRKDRTALILLIAVVLIAASGRLVSPEATAQDQIEYAWVTVCPGDTLWDIALRYRPQGTDIRAFVDHLQALNSLDTPMIRPGQTIQIPLNNGG